MDIADRMEPTKVTIEKAKIALRTAPRLSKMLLREEVSFPSSEGEIWF